MKDSKIPFLGTLLNPSPGPFVWPVKANAGCTVSAALRSSVRTLRV